MRLIPWLVLALAQDPEARYDLKFERPPVEGEEVEIDQARDQTMKLVVKMGEQVLQEQSQSESGSVRARVKAVKVADGKLVEALLAVTRAARSRNGQEMVLGVSGKSVRATREPGKPWAFEADGAPVPDEEAALLREAMPGGRTDEGPSGKAIFAPKNPVKAGESWPVDMEKLGKSFGEGKLTHDPAASKGTMTLKSVRIQDGAVFGAIEGDILVSVTAMGPLPLETPLPLRLAPVIDACIDGKTADATLTMKGTMKGTTQAKPPGVEEPLTLDLDMTVSMRLSMKPVP